VKQIKTEKDIASMFDSIAGRYDLLNNVLSAKQDIRWRKHLVSSLPSGPDVRFLDAATGTGEVIKTALDQGKEFAEVIGTDISDGMLDLAKQKISGTNVSFRNEQATDIKEEDNSIDGLSISFGLRNVVEPLAAIEEFQRVLSVGGKLLILEFFKPQSSLMNSLYTFYFRYVLPLVGGFMSNKSAYQYLPESVQDFMTLDELCSYLIEHGFVIESTKNFLFGNCGFVCASKVSQQS